MEDMKANLLLRKKLLLIELNSINEQLDVFNTSTTVQGIPEGESQKNTQTSNEGSSYKIDCTQGKSTTNPTQTVVGKDKSNPLKTTVTADALLKSKFQVNTGLSYGENSKLVFTSPPALGKGSMTNLSTNALVQELVLKPDYLNAVKMEQKRYYVVYKGPRAGVYTNWGEVSRICQEDKSTTKKFRSREQADMEFQIHGEKHLKMKSPTTFLRPKLVPKIEKIKEERRLQREKLDKEEIELIPIVHFQEFMQLWYKARAACQEDFIQERFYTTDKPSKSLYNFVEGADATLVYQAFRAGLIDNIYPSNNLLELKEFPKRIQDSIKHFRKKVLKAQDKLIYIKVVSSIPDWNHEENHAPYHFMEIGLAKTNKEMQVSKVMQDKQGDALLEVIQRTRVQGLRRIAELTLQSLTEGTKSVNYADKNCIVTSHKKTSGEEDIQLLNQFGLPFLMNTFEAKGTTKEAYCRHAVQLFEEHSCLYCQDKDEEKDKGVGPSTIEKEPTTDEESSS